MTRHSPAQQLTEARQIAKDHGMVLFEKPIEPGKTSYIVYRKLPDGRKTFLGKRGTPEGVRAYVARLANFH
jgi:hypothetical protein